MATNITIDETTTNVNISGVTETTPAYTTITLSNEQGAQGPTGATGTVGVDAGELTNTGTPTAAQLGLATAGTAGTYTKVTTDAFGRVSSGTTLSATDIPSLDASKITGTAVINSDSRLTDSRTPSGSAGGDLTGTYPNPTLASAGTAGTYTKVTTDSKGRVTSGTTLSAGDVPTLNQSTTGNAGTATALETARTINGVSFNGTANITVADSTKAPLTGATFTGQTSVQSTSSSTVPLFVKPNGTVTVTGVSINHAGSNTYDTVSVLGTNGVTGFYVGQSVTFNFGVGNQFTGTTTITSVLTSTLRVDTFVGTGSASASGGTLTATAGTQQNLQEWQYGDGTVAASISASGVINGTINGSTITSGIAPSAITGTAVTRANYSNSNMNGTTAIDVPNRAFVTTSRTLTSGLIHLTGFIPIETFTLNNINFYVRTAGSANAVGALCTVSGTTVTVVAVSDVLATGATTGLKTLVFTTAGSQTLTAGTQYAIALLAVGTAPGVMGATGAGTDSHAASIATSSPFLYAQSSTTSYTSMPTAGNTIGVNTSNGISAYPYVRLN